MRRRLITGRKVAWILVFTAITFTFIICSLAQAGQEGPRYRMYIEQGGMGVIEKGVSEGHKYYSLIGGQIFAENMRAKATFGLEAFFRGEPADEDPEILQNGAAAYVEYEYKWNDWFHPYLGASYNHWSRDRNYYYEVEVDQKTVIYFAAASGGARFKWKWLWLDAGTIIPFWTNTQSGNFGIDSGIGITYNGFDIGYRYKRVEFTDHHFQSGNSDMAFTFSGCEIGYKF